MNAEVIFEPYIIQYDANHAGIHYGDGESFSSQSAMYCGPAACQWRVGREGMAATPLREATDEQVAMVADLTKFGLAVVAKARQANSSS